MRKIKEEIVSWNEKGFTYLEKHEYKEAIWCFNKVIELDPFNYGAWFRLGALYAQKEDYLKAIRAYKRAWELNIYLPNIEDDIHHCYDKILKLEPKNSNILRLKGDLYYRQGYLQHDFSVYKSLLLCVK